MAQRVARAAQRGEVHRALLRASGVDGGDELDVLRRWATSNVPSLVQVRVRTHADHLISVLIEVKHLQLIGFAELKRGDEKPIVVGVTFQGGQRSCLPLELVRSGSIELEHVRSQPRGRIEMSR